MVASAMAIVTQITALRGDSLIEQRHFWGSAAVDNPLRAALRGLYETGYGSEEKTKHHYFKTIIFA